MNAKLYANRVPYDTVLHSGAKFHHRVFMNHATTQQIIVGCPITSLTKNKHTSRRFQKIRTLLKK